MKRTPITHQKIRPLSFRKVIPERRTHQRYPVKQIVSCDRAGKRFLTVTLDLGLGGMKIKTPHSLQKDEMLDMKLVLKHHSVCLKGRAVYSRLFSHEENVSGIQLMEISERDRLKLHDYFGALGELSNQQAILPEREEGMAAGMPPAVGMA